MFSKVSECLIMFSKLKIGLRTTFSLNSAKFKAFTDEKWAFKKL